MCKKNEMKFEDLEQVVAGIYIPLPPILPPIRKASDESPIIPGMPNPFADK